MTFPLLKKHLYRLDRFNCLKPRGEDFDLLHLLCHGLLKWFYILLIAFRVTLLNASYFSQMAFVKARYYCRLAIIRTCFWMVRRVMAGVKPA